MNAQKLINESYQTDFEDMFYPDISMQKKVDLGITKCLRDLDDAEKNRTKMINEVISDQPTYIELIKEQDRENKTLIQSIGNFFHNLGRDFI